MKVLMSVSEQLIVLPACTVYPGDVIIVTDEQAASNPNTDLVEINSHDIGNRARKENER